MADSTIDLVDAQRSVKKLARIFTQKTISADEFSSNVCCQILGCKPTDYAALLRELSDAHVRLLDEFAAENWAAVDYDVVPSPFIVDFNDERSVQETRRVYGPRYAELHRAIKTRLELARDAVVGE